MMVIQSENLHLEDPFNGKPLEFSTRKFFTHLSKEKKFITKEL